MSAIPTQYTRAVFKKADFYIPDEAVIISASKGIERGTLLTVSSIFKEITGHKVAVLSGPSFAKEAIMKKPYGSNACNGRYGHGLAASGNFNYKSFQGLY